MNRRGAVLLLLSLGAPFAAPLAQEVGSAPVRGVAVLDAPDLVLPKHALAAQRYQLPPVSDAELAPLRARNAEQKLLHVGIARTLPAAVAGGIALDALAWHALPDGSRVTTLEFASPDAAALRVSLAAHAFPDGLTLRTYAADKAGHLHGAVDAGTLASGPALAWLPEQPGATLGIELHAGADADLRGAVLPLRSLMHLVITPHDWDAKRLDHIGDAGACNIDIACAGDEWFDVGRAVAKYIFNTGPTTAALCTGTLLNNMNGDGAPYFVSARHCITDADRAASMTFYWHFERATCGGADPDSVIQTTGGATRLATVTAQDMVLLRLNSAPPPTALLAGWNANAPVRSSPVVGLHHPGGDLKMYSAGSIAAFTSFNGGAHSASGAYLQVFWSDGTTEQGSSGSATFNASAQVVGTLRGGAASCSAPDDPDWYGRFDLAYPSFTTWLGGSPPTPPPTQPPPSTPPPSGGGGGHGGLLLFAALAWPWRARRTAWTIRSGFSATRNGRRSLPTRS